MGIRGKPRPCSRCVPILILEAMPTTAPRVLSPAQLTAWDTCPAAYRWTYVERLPVPAADQRPRLLSAALHALLAAYVRHCVAQRVPQAPDVLDHLPRACYQAGVVAHATVPLYRAALHTIRPFLTRWPLVDLRQSCRRQARYRRGRRRVRVSRTSPAHRSGPARIVRPQYVSTSHPCRWR